MKKPLIIIVLLIIIAVVGVIVSRRGGGGSESYQPAVQNSVPSIDVPSSNFENTPESAVYTERNNADEIDNSAQDSSGLVKEFTMTAKQWKFQPDTITVNRGDQVKLSITSVDVEHGIAMPDFGISSTLNPGQTTEIEFVADKSGTFSFFCSVFCGVGHGDMRGTLIVK